MRPLDPTVRTHLRPARGALTVVVGAGVVGAVHAGRPGMVGGIVPARDEKLLLAAGVARVFHPGSSLDDIATEVRTLTAKRRATAEGYA